jgi:hypothetical protein
MITDGYVITEPTQITTTDGEVLGTMLAGSRVYYLDAEGKLQSVIRPRILQLPSGNFFAYNLNYDYITEEKKNELLQDTDYLQATFGQLVGAILTSDMANLWEEWISIYQITFRSFYEMKDQVLKFENSKRELLQRFLQSGDPSIQLIFPFQEFAGKVRILKLPRS